MIQNIIDTYSNFSDSWITSIKQEKINQNKQIEIVITCANVKKNFKYETIRLIFKEVTEFVFIENKLSDNFSSSDVYISEENQLIVFDFFPVDHFDFLEENINSKFKIKCNEVEYEFIAEY